jgi:transcription elongation factor Elf1
MTEIGKNQVYHCPSCHTDTSHTVKTRQANLYGVICNRCQTASLVRKEELLFYQDLWEDEVKAILMSLDNPDDK